MVIAFPLITPPFFIQFQIFLYPDTQETESFQMSPYLHGLGPKIKIVSAMPIYGYGCSPRPDGRIGSETPPKVAPMGGAFWSTPISKMSFLENLGWTKFKLSLTSSGAIKRDP